jgi:hypothetical protein
MVIAINKRPNLNLLRHWDEQPQVIASDPNGESKAA